jgi:cob(I)alamin adenosyltransferase
VAIYTKKGDKGETGLYQKDSNQKNRMSKDSLKIEALGAIDELNSYLGVTALYSEGEKIQNYIKEVQKNLLTIGSIVAGAKLRLSKSQTLKLERVIDELEGALPVLKNFVIPGGSRLAGHLHYARSLSRRVERRVVGLSKLDSVSPNVLTYLNRLSDYLFMLAREANKDAGVKEIVWVGKKK